jgi:heat shock protein HslJ
MLKKITIFALLTAFLAVPNIADAKTDRKKKTRQDERMPVVVDAPQEERSLAITNHMDQLNGEWNVVEIKNEEFSLSRSHRLYLYFDVRSGMLYGNTELNTVNANYTINGDKITISNTLTTHNEGLYSEQSLERSFLNALGDVNTISLSQVGDVEYMELKNKRNVLLKLRRQNLDFMNGPWDVKMINGVYVIDRQIRMVNDIEMLTVHINSGCNIVNGVISIDPTKEFGIEYENLISQNNQCPNIDTETRLLIALEETLFCRKSPDNENEVELFTREIDETGKMADKVLVVLHRSTY